jgi:hypothetical protein
LRRLASDGSQHRAADRQYRAGVALCFCTEVGNLPVGIDDALLNVLRCREVDGAVPGKTPARAILATSVSEGPFAARDRP